MKVWKISTVTDDQMLCRELNRLTKLGCAVKEVLFIEKRDYHTLYKVIYTEEDIMEAEDVSN
jgi:hypothetical protein